MERRQKISPTHVSDKGTCVRSESCLEIWKVRYQGADFIHINSFQYTIIPWKFVGNVMESFSRIKEQETLGRCGVLHVREDSAPQPHWEQQEVYSEIVS